MTIEFQRLEVNIKLYKNLYLFISYCLLFTKLLLRAIMTLVFDY